MKNIFKISQCGIAALLTLCILLGIAGISVHATAGAEETAAVTEEAKVITEDNATETEEKAQELVPVMTRGCSYPTLDQYLYQNASIYGFSVNDIKYGHDIQLSNGYYYHAGQYGTKLQCFIYDPSGECVAFSTLSSM